jgi:F420-0:gamma-glutamyl ligase
MAPADIVVVAQKIVSKAEPRRTPIPAPSAGVCCQWACGKDFYIAVAVLFGRA